MIIHANNINDIDRLLSKLHRASIEQRIVIFSNAIYLGLMKPHPFNLVLRFIYFTLKKTRGYYGIYSYLNHLENISPKTFEEWYQDLTWHIAKGKDTEDKDSVGGFSQREIDLLLSKVAIMLEQI